MLNLKRNVLQISKAITKTQRIATLSKIQIVGEERHYTSWKALLIS